MRAEACLDSGVTTALANFPFQLDHQDANVDSIDFKGYDAISYGTIVVGFQNDGRA